MDHERQRRAGRAWGRFARARTFAAGLAGACATWAIGTDGGSLPLAFARLELPDGAASDPVTDLDPRPIDVPAAWPDSHLGALAEGDAHLVEGRRLLDGADLFQPGAWDAAAEAFRAAIAAFERERAGSAGSDAPLDHALWWLAETCWRAHRFDEARAVYERLAGVSDRNKHKHAPAAADGVRAEAARLRLGDVAAATGHWRDAAAVYDAGRARTKDAVLARHLGWLAADATRRAGDRDGARIALLALWRANAGDDVGQRCAALLDGLGVLPAPEPPSLALADRQADAGRASDALATLDALRAGAGAAEPPAARLIRAHALVRLGGAHTDEARVLLEALLALKPPIDAGARGEALATLARLHQKAGRADAAIARWNELASMRPPHPLAATAAFFAAWTAYDAGKLAAAARGFETFVAEHPRDEHTRDARWYLAWCLFQQERWKDAAAGFASARAAAAEGGLRERYWEARARERAGQTAQGRADYVDFVALAPLTYYGVLASARLEALRAAVPPVTGAADGAWASTGGANSDSGRGDASRSTAGGDDGVPTAPSLATSPRIGLLTREVASTSTGTGTGTSTSTNPRSNDRHPAEPGGGAGSSTPRVGGHTDVAANTSTSTGTSTSTATSTDASPPDATSPTGAEPLSLRIGRRLVRDGLPDDARLELRESETAAAHETGLSARLCTLYRAVDEPGRALHVAMRRLGGALERPPCGAPTPASDADVRALATCLYPRAYEDVASKAAADAGIGPLIVWSIMREESHFDRGARSGVGALGLMQLMVPTARRVAERLGVTSPEPGELTRPEVNVRLGAWYLGQLVERFRGQLPLAVGAYNAGPGAMAQWLARDGQLELDAFVERVPYRETRSYIKRVLSAYAVYRNLYPDPGAPSALTERLGLCQPGAGIDF